METKSMNLFVPCVTPELQERIIACPPEDLTLAIDVGLSLINPIKTAVATKVSELCRNAPDACEQRAVQQNSRQIIQTSPDLPVHKGQIGEAYIESILRKQFGNITNVASVSKSGDLTLYIQHHKIIVEVKNYSKSVPTAGVEKFQRDLTTTNANGGIFISLRSPITSLTQDFTIRWETSDTKTVPCAYIVSADPPAIIVAVNMVVSLIQSFDYINAELYSRDKVISGVHEIAGGLDNLARARNDLQVNVNSLSSQMMKTTLMLTTAECGIRRAVDGLRSELFHTCAPDTEPAFAEMEKNPMFSRQSAEVKTCVINVMKCIQETLCRGEISGNIWKLSAKKCVNSATNIGFSLFANKLEIFIPRAKVSSELIVAALDIFGAAVNVGQCLCIELDNRTCEWVCAVIRGDPAAPKQLD